MKKFTFLLTLLLATGATSASAQVLDRSGWSVTTSGECDDASTGHAAAIIDGNNGTYWHSNYGGGNASGDATKKLPQFFVVDLGSEQTFRSLKYIPRSGKANGTANTFKVYVSNTAFQAVDNTHTAASIVNALTETPAMEGTFDYSGTGSQPTMLYSADQDVTGRYVMFVITSAVGTNFGSCAEFNLSKDNYKVTYTYTSNGTTLGTKTAYVANAETDAPQYSVFYVNENVTKTGDGAYTVECGTTTPFESASSYDASTAKWYVIDIHNNQGNLVWKAADDGSISVETISTTATPKVSDYYKWTFVGNVIDGYSIYNKATGKAAVLGSQLTLSDTPEVFHIKESTASNKTNGFCFYKAEGNYLNHQGSSIKTYEKTDEGSTMHVQNPDTYALNYAAAFSLYDDSEAPEGAIGANSYLTNADNLAAFKSAYAAASAEGATSGQIAALETINESIASATTSTIEADKYYYIYNAGPNNKNARSLYLNVSNGLALTQTAGAANTIVKFINIEAEPGRYRMQIEGKTFGKYKEDYAAIELVGDDSNEKGSYVVDNVGTQFTFYDYASNKAHSYLHCNGGQKIVGWDAGESKSHSRWYIVPATDVKVALTTIGSDSYASAYLPFSVSHVEGAKAYVGTLNDTKDALTMTEVTSIPANTGFVLVGDASATEATLTIGDAGAIEGGNALEGTNTNVTLADDTRANYLAFGVHNNVVGFYTPSSSVTSIVANKAYLNASSLSAAAIALNFGGTTTGINNATATESVNAPVYDLSGRRVVKAVKGGVYIQNGKKFVK